MHSAGGGFLTACVHTMRVTAGAMVGIGGPPVFLLFKWLNTPKDEARATGVFMGVMSPRPLLYWLAGLFHAQPTPVGVYVACVVSGLLGSMLGDYYFNSVNQQVFGKTLVMLVAVAAFLMLLSSAGLINST
jgi:uncharacterized membrane protein YfcA